MNMREVKKLHAGDEFISHMPNRDRRAYRVSDADREGICVVDQYGYGATLRFSDPSIKRFFANALPAKIQQ